MDVTLADEDVYSKFVDTFADAKIVILESISDS